MGSSSNGVLILLHSLGVFLTFAVEVALLVVALTTVRSQRPDAAVPIAAGAGIHLFGTIVGTLVHMLVTPVLVRSGSLESFATISAAIGLAFTVVHLVGWGAIILGIFRLASPPRPNDPTRYG